MSWIVQNYKILNPKKVYSPNSPSRYLWIPPVVMGAGCFGRFGQAAPPWLPVWPNGQNPGGLRAIHWVVILIHLTSALRWVLHPQITWWRSWIKEEEEDCFFIKNSLLGPFFLSEKRNCRCCFGKPSTMGAIQESLMFLCGSEEEEEEGEKLHQVHEQRQKAKKNTLSIFIKRRVSIQSQIFNGLVNEKINVCKHIYHTKAN